MIQKKKKKNIAGKVSRSALVKQDIESTKHTSPAYSYLNWHKLRYICMPTCANPLQGYTSLKKQCGDTVRLKKYADQILTR